MTLILSHMSQTEQLLVADRKLTDARNGRLVADNAFKIFLFCNPDRGYQFAVAFTGLATLGDCKTIDWLRQALPLHLSDQVELATGLARFKEACSRKFASLRLAERDWKRTIFVLTGRYLDARTGEYEPVTLVVGNVIDGNGDPAADVREDFGHYFLTRQSTTPPERFWSTEAFGDTSALTGHDRGFFRTARYLRRPIPASAKLELAARFIRSVGRVGSSVGKDVQGLILPRNEMARAAEWAEVKGGRQEMPPYVHASGVAFSWSMSPGPFDPSTFVPRA